jgi:hypothetical protein
MKNYAINSAISWDFVGDKDNDDVILFNEDTKEVLIISNSAGYILNLIINNYSYDEMIKQICNEYCHNEIEIEKEVLEFIDQLICEGIIIES